MNELIEIYRTFKKSPLKYLKNNLNLIIILPALLGGLWQLIELSRISFSFIRFFSVSQIIPDGLLILLFLIIFTISVFILFYFWKKLDNDDEEVENNVTIKKGNALFAILFILLFFGCIVLVAYCNNYFIKNIESLISLFLYLPVNIVITLFAFAFLGYSVLHCKDIEILNHLKKVASNISIVFISVQIIMLISFMVQFHNVFLLPAELKNVDNLICKAEKVEDSANFEILYSNDKYIFVRYYKSAKDRNGKHRQNEIRIFRFEDLLDDTACIGNKRIRKEFVKDSIKDSKIPMIKD
ncbi:hypothetical protein FQU23_015980 [Flavobacterium sp. XN-5]|uniref:hypothetical protein n=1 Tax=Flavobacterium sp. XN-5 TaxID=2599390 RepID=UPI0011C80A13|nr:hypothetical protein [Flavobacterium sp. XN-5]NGY38995.1 hypothetical protein [Flavobacterium sp. XN-5]